MAFNWLAPLALLLLVAVHTAQAWDAAMVYTPRRQTLHTTATTQQCLTVVSGALGVEPCATNAVDVQTWQVNDLYASTASQGFSLVNIASWMCLQSGGAAPVVATCVPGQANQVWTTFKTSCTNEVPDCTQAIMLQSVSTGQCLKASTSGGTVQWSGCVNSDQAAWWIAPTPMAWSNAGAVCTSDSQCSTGSCAATRCCQGSLSAGCNGCDTNGQCSSCAGATVLSPTSKKCSGITVAMAAGTFCTSDTQCASGKCETRCCASGAGTHCQLCSATGTCLVCEDGYAFDGTNACVANAGSSRATGVACSFDQQCGGTDILCRTNCCNSGASAPACGMCWEQTGGCGACAQGYSVVQGRCFPDDPKQRLAIGVVVAIAVGSAACCVCCVACIIWRVFRRRRHMMREPELQATPAAEHHRPIQLVPLQPGMPENNGKYQYPATTVLMPGEEEPPPAASAAAVPYAIPIAQPVPAQPVPPSRQQGVFGRISL